MALSWVRKWVTERNEAGLTKCYCPGCKKNLTSRVEVDGTKLFDHTGLGEEYVRYICGYCKTYSTWDFDSYPAPVLIKAIQHRIWVQQIGEDGITRLHEKVTNHGENAR